MSKKELHLNIVHGDEYRSRVGSIYEENTFFRSVYQQAGRCIREIIEANKRYEMHLKERVCSISSSDKYNLCPKLDGRPLLSMHGELASYPNNIIAFCGRRGQGKTSAMVSFSKALEYLHLAQNKEAVHVFWSECLDGMPDWENWEFIVIDPVDPTSMEQTDSILRILLSRMYVKFRQFCEDQHAASQCQDQFENQMNQILGDFKDCYKTLDTLKDRSRSDDYYYDDLSNLADLGDSSCMKQKMTTLVSDFCQFIRPEQNRQKMLVLQLDDTDLNSHHAYEILEDIRKYLVIPGVVILMATEMTQLSLIVEQHFICEFKEIMDYSNLQLDKQDTLNRMNCHNSAENYIGKLFPGMHQIHLPTLDEVIRRAHSQIYLHYQDEQNHDLLRSNHTREAIAQNSEYQKVLINQVYNKTRIVLLEPHSYLQNFLPATMRQLTHFLTVLNEMSDLDPEISLPQMISEANTKCQEQKEILLHNLDLLSDYFRFVWCPIHLTTLENLEMQKIFTSSSSFIHQQVMLSLKKIQRAAEGEKGSELAEDAGNGQRYLYGDVLKFLYDLRQSRYREWFYKICFATEFYYTLYNFRRLITGKINVEELQAAADSAAEPNYNLGIKFDGEKLRSCAEQNKDIISLATSACLAYTAGAEATAEPVTPDTLKNSNSFRFDPQYLLFSPTPVQVASSKAFTDSGMSGQQETPSQTSPYPLQDDAKLIYWATPELQRLYYKSALYILQNGN